MCKDSDIMSVNTFEITEDIEAFEIIRPGTTLKKWFESQRIKPDVLLNASLYTNKTNPCGTIIENGKLVKNSGTGFGVGTIDYKSVEFGTPWEKSWKEYLTGYNGIVQNGQLVPPGWYDKYVFDTPCTRIGIGKLNNDNLAIFCSDAVVISEYGQAAIDRDFNCLCNLDGGGSRALYWKGQWVYTSSRTPYNAIAIWFKPPEGTIRVTCKERTEVLDSNGEVELRRYIDKGDICYLTTEITSNLLHRIEYPIKGGTRIAYIQDLSNFER